MRRPPRSTSRDIGVGAHDRILTFARERGLTVRPVPTANAVYEVEIRKEKLLIVVTFENSRRMTEWFLEACDPLNSEKRWSDSFDHWEWFDHFGDADKEDLFEDMGDHLIAFLDALLTNDVRLAQGAQEPFLRLLRWSFPSGERTVLQLLIDGIWVDWDASPPLYPDQSG